MRGAGPSHITIGRRHQKSRSRLFQRYRPTEDIDAGKPPGSLPATFCRSDGALSGRRVALGRKAKEARHPPLRLVPPLAGRVLAQDRADQLRRTGLAPDQRRRSRRRRHRGWDGRDRPGIDPGRVPRGQHPAPQPGLALSLTPREPDRLLQRVVLRRPPRDLPVARDAGPGRPSRPRSGRRLRAWQLEPGQPARGTRGRLRASAARTAARSPGTEDEAAAQDGMAGTEVAPRHWMVPE